MGAYYGGRHPEQMGQVLGAGAPFLEYIPYCQIWCTAVAETMAGYLETGSVQVGAQQGIISAMTSLAFAGAGAEFGNPTFGEDAGAYFGKALVEGSIGGMMSSAGGGSFGDGFIGAFVSGEVNSEIGLIGGDSHKLNYYSPQYKAARAITSAIVGGTISKLSGGDFADAAIAAAMQRLYNDDMNWFAPEGYTQADLQQMGRQQQAQLALKVDALNRKIEIAKRIGTEYEKNKTPLQDHYGPIEIAQGMTVKKGAEMVGAGIAGKGIQAYVQARSDMAAIAGEDSTAAAWEAGGNALRGGSKWYTRFTLVLGVSLEVGDFIYSAAEVCLGTDGGSPACAQ